MNAIKVQLEKYKLALDLELTSLLSWWKTNTIDEEQGGFFGEVSNDNQALRGEPKGIVLNSRILWTFSAAFLLKGRLEDLAIAKRAFEYMVDYFYDLPNGGFYWSLSADGKMLAGKKQIYGQAFAIYGLAEYFKATGDEKALELAKETFQLIEKHSFDPLHLGYIEAFDQTWQSLADLRLSDKDLNAEKSMNTHLHIVEAYANLYGIWKDERLAKAIKDLLFVFKKHIIIGSSLSLFFSTAWQPLSAIVSFGHDIEAAWLLQECAEILADEEEIAFFKSIALQITDATIKGVDGDGGMYYEYDASTHHLVDEKHWWPQAEAMVGFFNAFQLTGNSEYLTKSIKTWSFIFTKLRDHDNGEWFWGIYRNGTLMDENKGGFWKCPYHNGRACMEILKRATSLQT
ncbi:AGE family epimerase/isomerase [Pedobacter sp. Du54]|uniref:AGE family epimerase/isomerase n=1 Tax=Pedobacter anseongensis TaxID=3133439 RepID=UPI003097E8CC